VTREKGETSIDVSPFSLSLLRLLNRASLKTAGMHDRTRYRAYPKTAIRAACPTPGPGLTHQQAGQIKIGCHKESLDIRPRLPCRQAKRQPDLKTGLARF